MLFMLFHDVPRSSKNRGAQKGAQLALSLKANSMKIRTLLPIPQTSTSGDSSEGTSHSR